MPQHSRGSVSASDEAGRKESFVKWLRAAGTVALLLCWSFVLTGCETYYPEETGKKRKLEAVTHDGITSYVYREVPE